MKGCECCEGLDVSFSIRTPGDFRNTILLVHQRMRENKLVEIENEKNREILGIEPFECVSCDGPWNDFFSHYFQCTKCKKSFMLHVETYNGSGGKWETFDVA